MNSTARLVKFMRTCGRLKEEPRKGWITKAGVKRPESVADHIFRTALLAMLVGDLKGLDTCKMIRMAMVHDLAEAVLGDITPKERAKLSRDVEDKALRRMLRALPSGIRDLWWKSWIDFRGKNDEARLLRQIDKLEMALQATEYEALHRGSGFKDFIESAGRIVHDPLLTKMLKSIRTARGK